MSDLLRSLQGKLEIYRRRVAPGLDRLHRRHAIERVVDLNAVQARAVVLQELLIREVGRIKGRLPFFITEPGCSKPDIGHVGLTNHTRHPKNKSAAGPIRAYGLKCPPI